jgi:phosphate-selective porin
MTLDYLTSSTQLDEINRARVVDVLAPQRDLGLQYSGTFPQGEYQVAVINGEGVNARDANDQKDVVGRVVVHPSEGTHLGVSYLTGRKGADSVHRQRIGLEARYTRPHLDAWAEYLAGQDGKVDENGWFLLVARPVRPGQSLRPFIRYEQFEPNDTVTGDREDLLTLGVTWFYTANTKVLLNYERRDWQAGSVDNVVLLQGQIIY